MKRNLKVIPIIMALVILLSVLAGCMEKAPTGGTDQDQASVADDVIDISVFNSVEPSSEGIAQYQKDIEASGGLNDFVISDIVDRIISQKAAIDDDLYYPVLYRYDEDLYLWATTKNGDIKVINLSNRDYDYIGCLHHTLVEGETLLRNSLKEKITYTPNDGAIHVWEFNKEIKSFKVPEDSVYCGLSFWEGYIFRSGSDVYALRFKTTNYESNYVVCIAHSVKTVVTADYALSSDPWSQPLFLMEDGTLKAYVGWNKEDGMKEDDPSLLVEPQYEGGYYKGYQK